MTTLPPQTKYIIGNEACERFCFYGMKAILMVYMTDVLLMSKNSAQEIVHLFNAIIYILPLIGAWLADRFLGRYKTILFISLFYCLGNAVLAMSDFAASIESKQMILFAGLFIIAIGTGGIKPCVSAFVGDQAGGFDSQTMTRIYSAFYWSINFGSFFAMLVIPFVRDNWGYGIAFAIPGIFMALSTLVFWLGRKTYKHKEPAQPEFMSILLCRIFGGARKACERFSGEKVAATTSTALKIAGFIVVAPIIFALAACAHNGAYDIAALSGLNETQSKLCALLAVFLYTVAIVIAGLKLAATLKLRNFFGTAGSMLFCSKEETEQRYDAEERKGARNMIRILVTFLLVIPFWSLFDQTASSWLVQGKTMKEISFTLFDLNINFGAEQMQSLNPLLVMVLIPMLTLLVYPKVKKLASPLVRMGIGIVLAGLSFGMVAIIQSVLDSGVTLSILWQSVPYLVLTVAEILVSTTGLEYAYTAAGEKLKSIVSSFWSLTIALGNVLVICITSVISGASTSAFVLYGLMSLLVGLLFMFVTSRRCMQPEA
ncbi:MAG: MFS transporter [Akkermansia sp.]|nr:MFS transporter [Akkermansia sp.]